MYVNHITVFGNVVRDPEVKQLESGKTVANFSVATNRRWTKKDGTKGEDAEFHDIVAWGFYAELSAKLRRGQRVYVEGRMQTRSWETPAGEKRSRKEIVASNIILHQAPAEASQPEEATNVEEE